VFAITATALPEVLLVSARIHPDDRGYFQEVWHQARYAGGGVPATFVQDNLSFSTRGVVRGLHFQNPVPQGKLVCVLQGAIYDVAVDIRSGSPRFGRHVGVTLTAEAGQQLYVPEGFAHGFMVTSDSALVLYKCTAPYHQEGEAAILWNDPALGIAWPLDSAGTIVSARDARAPTLSEAPPERLFRYV
jgi:dTDP-4-dehydrorhamnose 3,5-epimerase